jgi:hypothetical protein
MNGPCSQSRNQHHDHSFFHTLYAPFLASVFAFGHARQPLSPCEPSRRIPFLTRQPPASAATSLIRYSSTFRWLLFQPTLRLFRIIFRGYLGHFMHLAKYMPKNWYTF